MSGVGREQATSAHSAAGHADQEVRPPIDLRLVGPAVAVWTGCLVSLWISAAAGHTIAATALAVLVICAAAQRFLPSTLRSLWPAMLPTVAPILFCLAAGAVITALKIQAAENDQLNQWAVERTDEPRRVTVQLVVRTDPQPLQSSFAAADKVPVDQGSAAAEVRYLLRATAISVRAGGEQWSSQASVSLFAQGGQWSTVIPGDRLEVTGTLRPDDFSDLPGAALSTSRPPHVLQSAPWWQQAAQHVRLRFIQVSAVLDPEPAGLLPGLILGDTTGIDDKLDQDAKAAGLAHLLAVSGTHFAILCGAALVLFRQAGPRRAALLGLVVLVSLVVLVRPGASVLRAAVMGSVTLLAFMVGRTRTALPALAAAVIALLLYDPPLAASPGFALSVQATAGLVLVAPVWAQSLQRRGVPAGWAEVLVIPVVAHLATTPVIAALSGTISLASVPANILVAPVVAPALIIGAIAALLALVWPGGAEVLIHVVGPLVSWIAQVAHLAAAWPLAQLPWPSSPAGVLALAGIIVTVVMAMRGRRTRAVIGGVVTGVLVVLIPSQALSLGWPPPDWLVVGCEVGQGDGFVLNSGMPGMAIVFDTGPDPVLMDDCLDRLQVHTISLLILTHLHADHIDGLTGVLDGRTVAAIGVGPGREPESAWRTVQEVAQRRAIPLVSLVPGQILSSGDVRLTVLGPDPDRISSYLGPNDQSVVIRAETGSTRVLFTGDIEDASQLALLNSGVDLSADVLKLPHHGSATLLPRFVAAVRASVVMVGVGVGNDFGHPTEAALITVTDAGATVILRTDLDGDIAVCLDDNGRLWTVNRGASINAGV